MVTHQINIWTTQFNWCVYIYIHIIYISGTVSVTYLIFNVQKTSELTTSKAEKLCRGELPALREREDLRGEVRWRCFKQFEFDIPGFVEDDFFFSDWTPNHHFWDDLASFFQDASSKYKYTVYTSNLLDSVQAAKNKNQIQWVVLLRKQSCWLHVCLFCLSTRKTQMGGLTTVGAKGCDGPFSCGDASRKQKAQHPCHRPG